MQMTSLLTAAKASLAAIVLLISFFIGTQASAQTIGAPTFSGNGRKYFDI